MDFFAKTVAIPAFTATATKLVDLAHLDRQVHYGSPGGTRIGFDNLVTATDGYPPPGSNPQFTLPAGKELWVFVTSSNITLIDLLVTAIGR